MDVGLWPDGDYSHGATFINASDRYAWESTFRTGTDGQRKMAQAMITASPVTSNDEIRMKMATYPDFGPEIRAVTQPGIDDVLGTPPKADADHMYDRAPTDFSGTPAGREASSVPSLPAY
jgi:hypothetical protein